MIPDYPEPLPFVVPPDREHVTGEPPQLGGEDYRNLGGGFVPPDHRWTSNPKSDQDELASK